METFKIENIKIPPVKVVPELDKDTGILKLSTHVMGIITDEIADLNSQAIRESLISLGWVPPERMELINTVIDRADNVANHIWGNERHDWGDLKEAMSELVDAVNSVKES